MLGSCYVVWKKEEWKIITGKRIGRKTQEGRITQECGRTRKKYGAGNVKRH